jgi:hypothetical protein
MAHKVAQTWIEAAVVVVALLAVVAYAYAARTPSHVEKYSDADKPKPVAEYAKIMQMSDERAREAPESSLTRVGTAIKQGKWQNSTGVDYEVYFAIVDTYQRVLDRAPSESELQEQRNRLETDAKYDVPALERVLRSSAEYRRLVALQKNLVHSELEGLLTEQQILAKVRSMYLEATGEAPDDATLQFLLERYRASQLDDASLTALIENIGGPGGRPSAHGSEAALYEKLGMTKEQVASLLDGVVGVRSGERACEKKLACPSGRGDDGSPDALMAAMSARNRDEMRSLCKAGTRADRDAELRRAGFGPGDPVGSWTGARPIHPPVCMNGSPGSFSPSQSQTALIGTLLQDAAQTGVNMNLF